MKRFYSVRFFASILLVSLTTSLYAVNYRFSASGSTTRTLAGSTDVNRWGRQAAYVNNHYYRVNQGKPSTIYVFGYNANSVQPTFSAAGWSDFAIANDDSGNLILGSTSSGLNATSTFARFYYSTPSGGTLNFTTGNYIAVSAQSGYSLEGGDSNNCRAQAIRAAGNVKSGTGYIYSCPTNLKYIFRFNCSSGNFSSITRYATGLSNNNGVGAMAFQYASNKILLCVDDGLYDCSLSGSGNSGSMSKTKINVTSANVKFCRGSAMALLCDHKFLCAPKNQSTFAIWDLTTNTEIASWSPFSVYNGSYPPYFTVNVVKEGSNKVHFYIDWRPGDTNATGGFGEYILTATEICETPTISVSGAVTSPRTVKITSATSGATIYYRYGTSGNWSTLTNGGTITYSSVGTQTLYAYAAKSGCDNSSTASASVTYNPKLATPTFTDTSGNPIANGTIFEGGGVHTIRINYPSGATLHYTLNGSATTASGSTYVDLGMSRSGSLTNVYASQTNYTNSDAASLTWYFRLSAPSVNYANGYTFDYGTNTVRISGTSGSTIYYNYNGSTISGATPLDVTVSQNITLTNVYQGGKTPDFLDSTPITLNYYVRSADVTYTPNTATAFNNSLAVTLTSASGGTIYYTTDGSTPSTSSASVASGGTVTVASTCQIKAFAVSSGYVAGNVTTSPTYSVKCAAPTFSEATGTQFTSMGTVTITAPTGCTLNFSINGEAYKSADDTAVTFNISEATSLSAYASRSNRANSDTITASYTVKCATPVITPGTGTYPKEQAVNISCSTPDATVHYTTDGTTPTASSPVYSAPLTVNDGSATNEYIPAYIMYAEEYFKSEHIIPASSLTSMGASAASPVTINSLTWYLSTKANDNLDTARFKVFLKEVSGTTLSDFSGPTDGTVVYEGELNPLQFTMTVAFTTPFEYHGGNLLVGVYTNTPGMYKSIYFRGVTTSDNCAGSGSNSSSLSSVTFSPKKFLPKTTFTYTPTPITIGQTTTIKAIAIKNNCVDSDVASETITITPQSNPVTNINVAYSTVIGVSANNPTGDLARIDGTVTFSRPVTSDGGTFPVYPSTFSGYYLDHYVVTVFTGSSTYAKTDSGENFLSVSIDAKSGAGAANTVSLNARDLKLNENTEVYVTAHYVYQPTSAESQSSQTTASVGGYTYYTYPPSIEARIYVTPHQMHKVWWGSEHEEHTVYADVYRVRVAITDASSTSTIPVSYYQLQVRRGSNGAWENISDRTIDNLYYGSPAATVYPAGFNLAAGRFPGNYKFNDHQTTVPPIGSGETDWDINLEYFYAFDVTNAYNPQTVTDPSQEDPMNWQFRISAVYGAGEGVTVDGVPVTVTTANVQSSDYSDYIQPSNTPIITEVDPISADDAVKEVRYFDLKGVQLNEAPQNGFYIEVRLYNSGRIETTKRLAR